MAKLMTALQARVARTILELGFIEAADLCVVSTNTLTRLEYGEDLKPVTVERIQKAYEKAGVIFIDSNGGGPGVRLKKQRRAKR